MNAVTYNLVLQKQRPPARGQLGPLFIGCYGGGRIRSCKANSIQGHSFLLPTSICRRSRTMPKVCSPLADL